MVSEKNLTYVSICTSAVLIASSLWIMDLFWVVVAAMNIVLLAVPLARDTGFHYTKKVLTFTIISAVIQTALVCVQMTIDPFGESTWLQVPLYIYFSTLFQTMMTFADGLMFVTLMDKRGVLVLTKRWMILYAMMFSLMISVISLFFNFVYLYESGIPVFNGDITETGYRESNNLMMTSAFVTTFISPFYAYATVLMTRGRGKEAFSVREVEE